MSNRARSTLGYAMMASVLVPTAIGCLYDIYQRLGWGPILELAVVLIAISIVAVGFGLISLDDRYD